MPPSVLFIKNPAAQAGRGLKYVFFAQNRYMAWIVGMAEKIDSAH